MRASRLRTPAIIAVVLASTFATGVLAGSGRGATFNLGVTNTVSGYLTKLTGSFAGPMLQIVNTSTASAARALRLDSKSPSQATLYVRNSGGGPAANFVANAGKAAFTVNTNTKIANLNADRLDGLDSSALQRRVTGTCSPGSMVTAVNPNGTVVCGVDNIDGGNASRLDGLDSTDFQARCTVGQVHDILTVAASPTFSATYTTTGVTIHYSCNSENTAVKRESAGVYIVKALNWFAFAVGNAAEYPSDDFIVTTPYPDGPFLTWFRVEIRDAGGGRVDVPFRLITY